MSRSSQRGRVHGEFLVDVGFSTLPDLRPLLHHPQWLVFDACPATACLDFSAARLARLTPDAKLVFMMRDPVAGAFSSEIMVGGLDLRGRLQRETSRVWQGGSPAQGLLSLTPLFRLSAPKPLSCNAAAQPGHAAQLQPHGGCASRRPPLCRYPRRCVLLAAG